MDNDDAAANGKTLPATNGKNLPDQNKLSFFYKIYPASLESKAVDWFLPRRVFWSPTGEDDDDDDDVRDKIKDAFCDIRVLRFNGLVQFWAPARTTRVLSTRNQPFVLECLDPLFMKYRLSCLDSQLGYIHEDEDNDNMVVGEKETSVSPVASAFLNRFPDVVLDLRVYKGSHSLVDTAIDCKLTSSILLPVFNNNNNNNNNICAGVVECSMEVDFLHATFHQLKLAVEVVNGLHNATLEIEKALKFTCESHHLTLAQAWITYDVKNHVPCPSSSSLERKQGMFVVKLRGYRVDSDADDYTKSYYDVCGVLPLKMGEGLVGRTLETCKAHFCKNLSKLRRFKGVLGLLSGGTKSSCLAICLRSAHTRDVDYALEFLWPRSRDHTILLESLLLTLKRWLPSFRFAADAQLGADLFVVHVEDSTTSGLESFNIIDQNQPSQVLEEDWQKPKLVKRKLGDLFESEEETAYDSDSDSFSFWNSNTAAADVFIVADCRGKRTLVVLQSSCTLANMKAEVEKQFKLELEAYSMEFEINNEKGMLSSDEKLSQCIQLWRRANKQSGKMVEFSVHVLPSAIVKSDQYMADT